MARKPKSPAAPKAETTAAAAANLKPARTAKSKAAGEPKLAPTEPAVAVRAIPAARPLDMSAPKAETTAAAAANLKPARTAKSKAAGEPKLAPTEPAVAVRAIPAARPLDMSLAPYAAECKAWPFEEAKKLIARLERERKMAVAQSDAHPRTILFETGYGPSGLPHIGTFGEVARTTMVRNAFRLLTGDTIPTRLICFSDDMDGLRKVPTNVPRQDVLREFLDRPLTDVPDPFSKFPSFGQHNNAMLRAFLDAFKFQYEFYSATECYRRGIFDKTLQHLLEVYDEVMAIMLPTLGAERQATYSPLLPVSPSSGKVLQVPMVEVRPKSGTVVYRDPDSNELVETPVTGGRVKCQWKADWAMRWAALGIDYEMAGKDLIDSVTLSSKICKVLGRPAPEGFNYELFLDDKGQKISKSKGNGLTIDDWLKYASPESLSLFMYNRPREAKKLYFDVIPKTVDDYAGYLDGYQGQTPVERLHNPVWHIHAGKPPAPDVLEPAEGDRKPKEISFALLINLVSGSNVESKEKLWGFIRHYAPAATPEQHPRLDAMVGYALAYYEDFVKPAKAYRAPTDKERAALAALAIVLGKQPEDASAEDLQNAVYAVGKEHSFEPLRDWFKALYEVLFGQSQGPRFGSFIAVYGVANTKAMIEAALAG